MTKRYRVRKLKDRTLRMYYGVACRGDSPEVVIDWGEGCNKRQATILYKFANSPDSILEQLVQSGFDIKTIQISIELKIPN